MKYNELEAKIRESLSEHINSPLENYVLTDEEVLDLIESKEYDNFSLEFRKWLEKQLHIILTLSGQ